jgi:hypothetical protein
MFPGFYMSASAGAPDSDPRSEFEAAQLEPELSFWAEFLLFLKHNKKWWLLPILIVLGVLSTLIVWASTSGAAPFIYPLF